LALAGRRLQTPILPALLSAAFFPAFAVPEAAFPLRQWEDGTPNLGQAQLENDRLIHRLGGFL
jgi:hypothetical protein